MSRSLEQQDLIAIAPYWPVNITAARHRSFQYALSIGLGRFPPPLCIPRFGDGFAGRRGVPFAYDDARLNRIQMHGGTSRARDRPDNEDVLHEDFVMRTGFLRNCDAGDEDRVPTQHSKQKASSIHL
jgi:hypothetical protein